MKTGYQQPSSVLDQTKKVSFQLSWGIAFLLVNIGLIIILSFYFSSVTHLWVFGLLFGFVLQRSRFCFAAAFRDVFLIGNTGLTRAVILGLIIGTIGFLFLEAATPGTELLLGMGKIKPAGVFTIAGSLMFGFGMVIAGGCASGMLMRMGEGYLMQWVAMIGFLVGSSIGAWNLGWWMTIFEGDSFTLFLPKLFGWPGAIVLQLFLLCALYFGALVYERGWKPVVENTANLAKKPLRVFVAVSNNMHSKSFYQLFFKKPWPYFFGAVVLALLNTMLFLSWGAPWNITSGITYFSGWLSGFFNLSPESWYFFQNILVLEGKEAEFIVTGQATIDFLNIPMFYHFMAIIAGSLLASLTAGEFRVRKWKSRRFVISALFGGFLMGYGARVALGCNIGAFFSAIPSFSLHGWVFGVFTLLGAFLGGKVLLKYLVV